MSESIKEIVPLLTIISQVFVLALFISFLFRKKYPNLISFLSKYAILIGLSFSGLAIAGSLFYSNVLGYHPCTMCWWQRIFIYPQFILFLLAFIYKDSKIFKYSIPLSSLGGLVALNHYILQTTGSSVLPCDAVGYSATCSKVFVMSYGYITIPIMALTAFLGILFSMMILKYAENTKSEA